MYRIIIIVVLLMVYKSKASKQKLNKCKIAASKINTCQSLSNEGPPHLATQPNPNILV